MKRRAPSSASLPAKRLHIGKTGEAPHVPISFSDLSDELCIQIFAQLSYGSLVNAMLVSRDWCRLTRDNQLWKQLFLRDHSPTFLKSVSTSGRGRRRAHDPYRPIRPLPSRALKSVASSDIEPGSSVREDGPLDWRWMYRLSSNWASGHCLRSETFLAAPQSQTERDPISRSPRCVTPSSSGSKSLPFAPSCLHLLGVYVLFASPKSVKAEIFLSPTSHSSSPFDLLSTTTLFPVQAGSVTVLQPDVDPVATLHRFAAFSSHGWISVYTLPLQPTEGSFVRQTHVYAPPGGVARSITAAAFHSPLLATINSDFTLHIFHVPPAPSSSNEPIPLRLLHTLRSFTSFPPASLSFSFPAPVAGSSSPVGPRYLGKPNAQVAKLTLHNLVPAYPSHWVPTAHQFELSLPSPQAQDPTFSLGKDRSWSIGGWIPGVNTSSDDDESEASKERNRRVRKLLHVGGIAGNAKVVYVAGDGALHMHRLKPSSHHLQPALSQPFPPSCPPGTTVLSLASDPYSPRCVASLSSGDVVVWDVELGNEATLLPPWGDEDDSVVSEVRFDEGRVVGVVRGKEDRLVVWDFDC